MTNKELIERYPFLLPRSVWTDKVYEDFDYSWTVLDEMPDGWRKAFGEMMCSEIKCELLRFGRKYLNDYRIMEIKEKYASLRWYDNGHPVGSKLGDIIGKYEALSEHICIVCGKPDVPVTGRGWYMPLCKDCWLSDDQNTEAEWNEYATAENNLMMPDVYEYSRYSKDDDKWIDIEIDISDTAEKIRRKWNDSH